MIPAGWEVHELSALCDFKSGGTPSKNNSNYWNGEIPWISAKDMKSFYVGDSQIKVTKLGAEHGTTLVPRGTLLILVRGMTLKKEVPICFATADVTFNQDVKAIVSRGIDPEYLGYYLRAAKHSLLQLVDEAGHGTGRLQTELLATFPVAFPKEKRQQRNVVRAMSIWERRVELHEQFVSRKIAFRDAAVRKLLTRKCRLTGSRHQWNETSIGDFITESRIPGSDGKTAKKISVKLYGKGVHEREERRIGSENTKYYIRRAGQFIYSKLDFLNGAFGIIPEHLDGYETTLDLPCFDVVEGLDARFLLLLVSREEFYSRFLGSAAGGRKARRVNPAEFLATKIHIPGIEEQRAIVDAVATLDREIDLLERQLAALKRQKQALMQQLLTGRIRVGEARVPVQKKSRRAVSV